MDFYKEWLGIPEGPRPPDHYELLRCRRFEDDLDKIRAHYKKLNAHVRKYATGQFSVQSQELLNELAKAMLCLTDPERKREYDESLGREFEPERDEFGRLPLLDVLVQHGDISREQKQEVEEFAERRGLSIRDAVVQMKLVSPDVAARALARQLGFSFVDLEDMVPEDDVLDRIPRSLVKKHSFLPLFIDDDRLMIACTDEIEHELEDELRLRFGVPVRPVLATPRAINQAIAQYYAPGMRDEARLPAVETATTSKKGAKSSQSMAATSPSAAAKQSGELNKPLLIVWGVILAAPILLRLGTLFSAQLNLWFVQMNQNIPLFGTLMIAVPLLGGVATFAYIQFVLKKKK
jgi:hypothetical protein